MQHRGKSSRIRSFFEDSSGRIVIGQFPNWPLWVAVGAWAVGRTWPEWAQITDWVTNLALLYWAYLEIRFGVNGWRRLLGWVVAFGVLFSIFL